MPSTSPVIAILEDEENMRVALRRLLFPRGYQVDLFETGPDLLAACAHRRIGCIILDLHMPGMSGFEVLERLTLDIFSPPVIVITGHDQAGNAERVASLGARAYLTKPVDEEPLLEAINSALGGPDASK